MGGDMLSREEGMQHGGETLAASRLESIDRTLNTRRSAVVMLSALSPRTSVRTRGGRHLKREREGDCEESVQYAYVATAAMSVG